MVRPREGRSRDTLETGDSSHAPHGESSGSEARAAEAHAAEAPAHAADTFSSLLWIPHVRHRVSYASLEDETMLTVRHRTPEIPYVHHPLMERCIMHLGLYQLATMPQSRIDQALICGLVERWRPETHSFHLPVGEMTVTLGDVSALWGLRIDGDPIGGVSDDPRHQDMIHEYLGCDPKLLQKKKKKGEEDEFRYSKYCISLAALRVYFFQHQIAPDTTDEERVLRYVRAFVMDLCGSVMFVDSSGDAVPIMFLSLLKNIDEPSKWNWGGAVLAHLYRSLCHACLVKNKQIAGPLLLLQQWSWSHLPVCRPVPPAQEEFWTRGDPERCPAYGAIWGSHHTYENTGKGRTVGISYVRGQLQMLHEKDIIWYPYRAFYNNNLLCRLTLEQRYLWHYRGPCVCFWIVEWHYPDRVARQFGLDAFIPDMPELNEHQTTKLHSTTHQKPKVDWSMRFADDYHRARYPQDHLWYPPTTDDVSLGVGPWALRYAVWYHRWGMPSVYLQGHYGETLRRRLVSDESRTYLPFGPIHARAILTGIRGVAHSLVCMARDSWRAIGCSMLQHTAPIVEDSGWDGRLVGMLRDAGENINWRDIRPTPRQPDHPRVPVYADEMPPPPAEDDAGWAVHQWVLNNNAWNAYYNKYGVPVQIGEDGAPVWQANPEFPMDDLTGDDAGYEVSSLHRPRYMGSRQHDREASGSGTQTAHAWADPWQYATYGTPPPATYPSTWEADPWELRTQPEQVIQEEDPWAAGVASDTDVHDLTDDVQVRRVLPHRDRHPPPRLDLSGRRPRR